VGNIDACTKNLKEEEEEEEKVRNIVSSSSSSSVLHYISFKEN
jgi:hypothetical protein